MSASMASGEFQEKGSGKRLCVAVWFVRGRLTSVCCPGCTATPPQHLVRGERVADLAQRYRGEVIQLTKTPGETFSIKVSQCG